MAAADLGLALAVAVLPTYNWNGFYIGAHVGGAWDQRIFSQTPSAPGILIESAAIDSSGVFGGGQIGYNWKATPSILLGLEADVSGTSLTGSAQTFNFAGTGPGWNVKDDVFGTVRGRVGWVVGDSWLLYGTGGLALVNDNFTRTQLTGNPGTPPAGLFESNNATRVGWAAGGGVEWGFAPNWSAKLEYIVFEHWRDVV